VFIFYLLEPDTYRYCSTDGDAHWLEQFFLLYRGCYSISRKGGLPWKALFTKKEGMSQVEITLDKG
jgi:hypothetical protein